MLRKSPRLQPADLLGYQGSLVMDPLSITTGCVALLGTIAKTSEAIAKFVRGVRNARSDMDAISGEIGSLKTVLELLADDVGVPEVKVPENLERQVLGIVANCSDVLTQLEATLQKYQEDKLSSKMKWTWSGKDDMTKFKSSLMAHKGALDMALELTAM
jgi:hypothetical protein